MRYTLFFLLLSVSALVPTMADGIYKKSVEMEFEAAYKKVYTALEDSRFYVIDEIDMGNSLARFKDKWKDFNLNRLEEQKIMIICNGWYANQVSNAATHNHQGPDTMGLWGDPYDFADPVSGMNLEYQESITTAIDKALN